VSTLHSNNLQTRLPTISRCVHLVTRCHFRSRDEDGGHTIRSARVENPMLHANYMTLCFIEPELLDLCYCCDLDVDPMTFIYDLDPCPARRYTACANMNFLPQDFRKLSSDRHTYRHDRNYIPRGFACSQLENIFLKLVL